MGRRMTWKKVMATSIDLPAEVDRRVGSLVIRTGRSKGFFGRATHQPGSCGGGGLLRCQQSPETCATR